MTRLTFHPEALAEFEAAVVHYECPDVDGDITILAVMHCHRHPGHWRHRAPQD